jgi:hypothetical protein
VYYLTSFLGDVVLLPLDLSVQHLPLVEHFLLFTQHESFPEHFILDLVIFLVVVVVVVVVVFVLPWS